MKATKHVSLLTDPKSKRSCFCGFFPAAFLLCVVFFLGTTFVATDFKGNLARWGMATSVQKSESNKCENQCRPSGSEALPRGIVSTTSNLEMRPLWGFPKKDENSSISLLAVAAGIKQKDLVNRMVEKFLSSGFVVMLFHYDGIVDEWTDFGWSDRVVHVAAVNQTKWWFAKRFLHPDIVADYSYIFVWDEDLGVEHFNPERYLEIVKVEGLEISQPALDYSSAELHHQITARGRRTTVHRRTYKPGGAGKGCDDKSIAPPCTGWIELMVPVFSRAAWRCVWYMIQNDLIHAWGLDMQLGYCAQGDRTIKIGVVDSEYVFHHGLPTLGAISENKMNSPADGHTKNENTNNTQASNLSHIYRVSVRRQSFIEWRNFKRRWKQAVRDDKCWVDPYN